METVQPKEQSLQLNYSQEWYDEQFGNIIANETFNNVPLIPVKLPRDDVINDLDSFFDDDSDNLVDGLDFDSATLRAAYDISDTEASLIIVAGMEKAVARGDFYQLRQMAMTLGALACQHNHMQDLANKAENLLGSHSHDTHDGHDHSHDDEGGSILTRRKKKKKAAETKVATRKRITFDDIVKMLFRKHVARPGT